MEAEELDEDAFFEAIGRSGARVLLIGRRALIALGVPVLTADYDLWLHIDDIEKLNEAVASLHLKPTHAPTEARGRGRYVLEGDEHVDVLVARRQSTKDGVPVAFDDVWERRRTMTMTGGSTIHVPTVADLILTKRWSMRAKDVLDIQLLEALRREEGS